MQTVRSSFQHGVGCIYFEVGRGYISPFPTCRIAHTTVHPSNERNEDVSGTAVAPLNVPKAITSVLFYCWETEHLVAPLRLIRQQYIHYIHHYIQHYIQQYNRIIASAILMI